MQKKSYFGKLGELKKIKEKNGAIIAICGCMMQEAHIQQKLKQSYPFVDIIFGTHTLHKLPEDLYNKLISEKKINDILDIDGKVYEGLPIKRKDLKKASVTIMYGCNNFCSYCIVPYVRGRERSRKAEDILKEIEELAKEGYKEITLLGQNVNSYMKSETKGKSKEGKIDTFAKLLYEVNKIKGIEKISFISPHPKDFTDDVIQAIKECNKVSRLVHLPLQSGSTRILKKMNRKYTKEDYLALVQKMRKELPNVLFSTDIIVGFPEETEEDIDATIKMAVKFQNYGCTVLTNLCHIMNGTELYVKYKDNLVVSKDTAYNRCIPAFRELYSMISSNKEMFANFCDFKSPLRDEMKYLDVFRYTLFYAKANCSKEHEILVKHNYASICMYRKFCKANDDLFHSVVSPSNGDVTSIMHTLKYNTSSLTYESMISNLINSL